MRDWPSTITPVYKRAVFIDRDGTINVDVGHPHKLEDLQIIPEAAQGLAILSTLPVCIIVITNQDGIGLKMYSAHQMSIFNTELRNRLLPLKGRIDAVYYCPDAETNDHDSKESSCAKPSPSMLLEAAKDFDINLSESFMIGDKSTDIAAGERAGCKTILVKTGHGGREPNALPISPVYVADNLLGAAKIVESLVGS